MSVTVMASVWKMDIAPTKKFVLLALADRADDEGWCWPGVASLMAKTGLAERTVRNCLAQLRDEDLLEIHEKPGNTNTYRLSCAIQGHPCTSRTPARRAPLHKMQGGGASAAPNTSMNHQTEPNGSVSSPNPDAYSAAFLEWWGVYPSKVGKRDAHKKWLQARKLLAKRHGSNAAAEKALQDAVVLYEAVPLPPDRQPPNPATWLNQGRYDDPIDAGTRPNGAANYRGPAQRAVYLDPLAAAANADMA